MRHRKKGGTTARRGQIQAQKLSPDQEEDLVNWILNEEAAGRALSKREVREFAQHVVSYSGRYEVIGQHWVNRFIERHESIKMKFSRTMEAIRNKETTEEKLRAFYDLLDSQIKTKGVGRARVFNVDEHGVAEGETKHGKVVWTSLSRFSTVSKSDSRTWVSIIETISATGQALTPVVILTGENLQGQWFPDDFPNWKYEAAESGWSNSWVFKKWFLEVFLPETAPPMSLWRILVLDGHKSHVTTDIMFLAWMNKVQLLYSPPHSSHITQPLDVGIFSPLQEYFHQQTAGFASFQARSPIQKQRFITAYKIAHSKALTVKNIRHPF